VAKHVKMKQFVWFIVIFSVFKSGEWIIVFLINLINQFQDC